MGYRALVRVNCMSGPYDAIIAYSKSMARWKTSTAGRARDTGDLEQIEFRVDTGVVGGDVDKYDRLCIFTQPPRIRQDGTACLRTPLDLGECNMSTMNGEK